MSSELVEELGFFKRSGIHRKIHYISLSGSTLIAMLFILGVDSAILSKLPLGAYYSKPAIFWAYIVVTTLALLLANLCCTIKSFSHYKIDGKDWSLLLDEVFKQIKCRDLISGENIERSLPKWFFVFMLIIVLLGWSIAINDFFVSPLTRMPPSQEGFQFDMGLNVIYGIYINSAFPPYLIIFLILWMKSLSIFSAKTY